MKDLRTQPRMRTMQGMNTSRNKTHNRNIYVPPEEYSAWETAALRESVRRGERVTVSNLIREAMALYRDYSYTCAAERESA